MLLTLQKGINYRFNCEVSLTKRVERTLLFFPQRKNLFNGELIQINASLNDLLFYAEPLAIFRAPRKPLFRISKLFIKLDLTQQV